MKTNVHKIFYKISKTFRRLLTEVLTKRSQSKNNLSADRTDKQILVYSFNDILLNLKNKQTKNKLLTHATRSMNLTNIML